MYATLIFEFKVLNGIRVPEVKIKQFKDFDDANRFAREYFNNSSNGEDVLVLVLSVAKVYTRGDRVEASRIDDDEEEV